MGVIMTCCCGYYDDVDDDDDGDQGCNDYDQDDVCGDDDDWCDWVKGSQRLFSLITLKKTILK